jgi:hypothetical protein
MRRVGVVSAVVLAVAVGLASSSCSTVPKGETIMRYDRGATAYAVKAPSTADYSLYASDSVEPRVTVRVEEGGSLGLEQGDGTGLVAIAGDQRIPVPYGSYTWRRR